MIVKGKSTPLMFFCEVNYDGLVKSRGIHLYPQLIAVKQTLNP